MNTILSAYKLLALGIQIFGSVSGRNHSVPDISDKSFVYPMGTYEISVRSRFSFSSVSGRLCIPILYVNKKKNIYIYIYKIY